MKRIAIFASGEGSNAARIMDYFNNSGKIKVALVVSNNPNAGVLAKAIQRQAPVMVLDRKEFFSDQAIIKFFKSEKIDLIALAGFLWMVPRDLIEVFPDRIINIHPALLPKHGGRGMFGMNVHRAVLDAGEKETGITIHRVNERFDEGEIIFQAKCKVDVKDTRETLAEKVRKLEHKHYPGVIEDILVRP